MKNYTFSKKASILVLHQMFIILTILSISAMGYFAGQEQYQVLGKCCIGAVAGLVGSFVALAYLTNTCGRKSEEDIRIYYHKIDFIPGDLFLFLFMMFIFLAVYIALKMKHQDFALAGLLITAGTLTYVYDVVFLIFYMSIMRRLKGNRMITGSLMYRLWLLGKNFVQSKGKFRLYTRKARERLQIQEAIEAIASGALNTTLDEGSFHGQEKDIAQAVNHIRDGMKNAVMESIRNEKLKADLITNVSHDIKTPLTSIVNYADLLKRENLDNEAANNYIRIIAEKSQRLKQLTEDLVEASKISSGNIKLDMQQIDFVELLYQTGGEFNERFEARELTIVTKLPHTSVMIEADGRQLYRVVENLYINAAKYALEKSRVYVELQEKEEKAVFTIKNISRNPVADGIGEFYDLTERFVRGEVSRTTEGSGLGLSIAKNLTMLMGGDFSIRTDDDLFIATLSFPILSIS